MFFFILNLHDDLVILHSNFGTPLLPMEKIEELLILWNHLLFVIMIGRAGLPTPCHMVGEGFGKKETMEDFCASILDAGRVSICLNYLWTYNLNNS